MQSCFPFLVFTLLITYSHMYLADGRMCSCPDCHAYLLSACPLVHVRARSQKGCGNDATRQFCKVPGTNEHAVLWSGLSLSTNLLHSSHEILRSSLITYSAHGLQEKDYRDMSEDAAQKQIAHGEKSCTSRLGYFCGQVRLCGASANGIQQTHPNPNTSIFFDLYSAPGCSLRTQHKGHPGSCGICAGRLWHELQRLKCSMRVVQSFCSSE
jgi:hypothetical protein